MSQKQKTAPLAGIFGRMSLTAKLASAIVLVNLVGLAVTVVLLQNSASHTLRQDAFVNWEREVEQIGAMAAGGIKWGVPEAVEESYARYTGSDDHALRSVVTFDRNKDVITTWSADGFDAATARADIDAVMRSIADEPVIKENADGLEQVTIVTPLSPDSEGMPRGYIATEWSTEELAATGFAFGMQTLAIQAITILVVIGVFLFVLSRIVTRPLGALTSRIETLQNGDLDTPVPHQNRSDTIGVVAQALDTFRDAASEKKDLDARSQREREAHEQEREQNARATERASQVQNEAMTVIGDALGKLAQGDLSVRIDGISEEFVSLRDDFNGAMESLSETMVRISDTTAAVRGGTNELSSAADDLSRRTEQQAASLEETAAACEEITTTVRGSASRAEDAGKVVGEATDCARSSRQVVEQAISAMKRIEESSGEINQIISVIDDIAFQTNLLALNAGVEAARAGDAGAGFAVVAQEVRELAQRSADAAKEIKGLITKSTNEVEAGVKHVDETGHSLQEIEAYVERIRENVSAIVSAAHEQTAGLNEVNIAVGQMDQVTQQNAAMAEETNAACKGLEQQAGELQQLVQRFRIAGSGTGRREDAEDRGEAQSPARGLMQKVAGAFGGSRAA